MDKIDVKKVTALINGEDPDNKGTQDTTTKDSLQDRINDKRRIAANKAKSQETLERGPAKADVDKLDDNAKIDVDRVTKLINGDDDRDR